MEGLRQASANLPKPGSIDVHHICDSCLALATNQTVLSRGKGDIWNGVACPAWCVTHVDQSTIFALFSCSINWFLIFNVLCMGLALHIVQDAGIFLSQQGRKLLAATSG